MVDELADLRRNRPWIAERITVPVDHVVRQPRCTASSRGMSTRRQMLGLSGRRAPDCRHDAPLSHPDLFRSAIVDPLLQMVGPPWSGRSTAQRC